VRIAIVAPSCPLGPDVADRVNQLGALHFGDARPELIFHPQCFLSDGHFAGPDQAREDAFVEVANDPAIDAVWFARGGYGACRMAERAISRLTEAARGKSYLGYSDAGFLLGGLYARGIGHVAHGPMVADFNRARGDEAIVRALDWLTGTLEPRANEHEPSLHLSPPLYSAVTKTAAFNLTVLSQMIGTPLMPDLTDHILMIEEVAEYMYRIDRSLFHITSNPAIRAVAGIKLGRCSQIPQNDVDFGIDEVAVIKHWCAVSGIPYLGRADIGHDADNKIVRFG
jgi:muramoyltetrapeptide carboxypeptidase